jgi:hypothetical protein
VQFGVESAASQGIALVSWSMSLNMQVVLPAVTVSALHEA